MVNTGLPFEDTPLLQVDSSLDLSVESTKPQHDHEEDVVLPNSSLYSSDEEMQQTLHIPSVHNFQQEMEVPIKLEADHSPTKPTRKCLSSWRHTWKRMDPSAIQFAVRMATALTISSLFVLIRTDEFVYPDAMWVLVSVLFVSWFPALDAASVMEKILQRLYGTFLGAFLGLGCGFVSLLFSSHILQCVFLACCMFVFNFGIIFAAAQCQVGGVKVIKKFSYATILAVLTFCIALMPFSLDKDPKWQLAFYRVMNVIVGCGVGALTAIFVCPKSTMDVLYEKAAKQVRMAGEASDAVLSVAAGVFDGDIHINRLADELLQTRPMELDRHWKFMGSKSSSFASDSSLNTMASSIRMTSNLHTDIALRKYDETINDWRLSKLLFPLMKYDPFHQNWSHGPQAEALHTEIARTLARALRIQTTIVVMDGMIRSEAKFGFDPNHVQSFKETGRMIRTMLSQPLQRERSNPAAKALFEKLDRTRNDIVCASKAVATAAEDKWTDMDRVQGLQDFRSNLLSSGDEERFFDTSRYSIQEDDLGLGLPNKATRREDNTLLFLQLFEHLILRSLRLYQAWKHAESLCQTLKAG